MNLANKTVMIADDDKLVRLTFKHVFEEAGYTALVADNGRDAIAQLSRTDVGTIFLDVFMPDQDGIETLLEIKRAHPETRVIVMSGGGVRGRYDFLAAATKFGADGVVRKPISPQQLIAMFEADQFRQPAA